MNETPPTVEVRTSASVFAVSTDSRLRNAGGISGDLDRDSIARNDPSTSTDRPSGTIVSSELKPELAAVGQSEDQEDCAKGHGYGAGHIETLILEPALSFWKKSLAKQSRRNPDWNVDEHD
jgi:hypothetical protein